MRESSIEDAGPQCFGLPKPNSNNERMQGMSMTFFNNRSFLAAAVVLGLTSAPALAATLKVSVAAEPYPPFASKSSAGQWEGFEVDLAKAVCKAASLDCEIVETAWDGIIPALTSKKIDVIFASMTITPERSKTILFSIPYYNTPAEFIAPKADKLELTPQGLAGKVIGVQTGTIHAEYVNKMFGKDSTVKIYNTQDEANSDLAAGRVDAVLADAAALDTFLASDGGSCCEAKGFAKDPVFTGGVGAGVRLEDKDLKAKLDAGIQAVYKDGEFDTLQKKYFKYDVGTQPRS
jgi:polar amino acid transport system substrate-binding protein